MKKKKLDAEILDAASRWGRPQPLHHFGHQSKHGNSGMLHSAARDIVISFPLIEKPEWKAVISFKASRPTAQGLCLSIGNNKKKETCLSEQVGLKATDFVWKAMFSFHAVELQGYRSTSNTEKDSVTRAAQSSELNSVAQLRRGKKVNLVQIFPPPVKKKKRKRKRYTKDQSAAQCCITNLLPVSIVKHCRQAELTEVSFEGFLLLFPHNHQPQPIGAWYEMLTHSHIWGSDANVQQIWCKHGANNNRKISRVCKSARLGRKERASHWQYPNRTESDQSDRLSTSRVTALTRFLRLVFPSYDEESFFPL